MENPFIDIHTHQRQAITEKVWSIRNQFPAEWEDKQTDGWFSVGIHPWYIESREEALAQLKNMEKALARKQCIALGEAGLDKITETDRKLQEEIFAAQVKLSETHNKPLIIHCAKAYSELLGLRKELRAEKAWIFHGFNSSYEMARQIIDHGCMLSFGQLLWKEGSKAESVIGKIEPEHWFLETDDEDISIESVYDKAALITGMQMEELKNILRDNFNRVFQTHAS